MASYRQVWDSDARTQRLQGNPGAIRILLVDDMPHMRDVLRGLIVMDGVAEVVGEAEDGVEALEMTAQLRPDLVLMDVNMPIMDGPRAASLITRNFPGIKVILMSAEESPELREAGDAYGIDGFIFKVTFAQEFAEVLRTLFEEDERRLM